MDGAGRGEQVPNSERLALEGTRNTRDIGGYRTADGMTVRRGVVFRSDGLDGLTASDVRQLSGLGIRTVIDLRGPQERAAGFATCPQILGCSLRHCSGHFPRRPRIGLSPHATSASTRCWLRNIVALRIPAHT